MRTSALLLWLLAHAALAQGVEDQGTLEERRLNAEGIALVQRGEHLSAIARFKEAEARVPRHAHDCNIAQAYLQLERLPQAWLFFERCEARMGPNPDGWLKEARATLAKKLAAGGYAEVTLHVEPDRAELVVPSFAADERWPVSGKKTLWLPRGKTGVELSAPGMATERRELQLEGGAAVELAFRLTAPVLAAPALPPPAPRSRLWTLAPLGAGVAAAGVGGYFLAASGGTASRLESLSAAEPSTAFTLARQAETQRTVGLAVGAGGLALAATGALLFFLLDGAPAAVTPAGGGGFALSASF